MYNVCTIVLMYIILNVIPTQFKIAVYSNELIETHFIQNITVLH